MIEDYWLNLLDLPKSCLRKTTVINKIAKTDQRKNKLPYGVARLSIHSVEILHEIYGAISYYGKIEEDVTWGE